MGTRENSKIGVLAGAITLTLLEYLVVTVGKDRFVRDPRSRLALGNQDKFWTPSDFDRRR